MKKQISQMTEDEFVERQISLQRSVDFWGLMYAIHPIPLLVIILFIGCLLGFVFK